MATSVAMATTAAQASGKVNEALPDIEAQEEEEGEKKKAERTLTTRIAQGVAAVSIGFNIAAIAIEQSTVTIIAGIVAFIIGPIVITQQSKLQDTGSMREVQNKLRKNVNELQVQNNRLSGSNTKLEGEVHKLKEQEARLEQITSEQGSNVNELVALVNENKELLAQMKTAVTAESVQILFTAILDADRNLDSTFTDAEITRLKLRLQNVEGIKVNERALERQLSTTKCSVDGILALAKQLDNDDVPEEERVFSIVDK